MIMKAMNIPIEAAGFAVMLALIIAKTEFSVFSDENDSGLQSS